MKTFRHLAALLAVSIAGCGGGGGGGSATSNEFSIGAVTPGSVIATFPKVDFPTGASVALTASYSGTASGTVYVVVVDPDAVFSSASVTLGGNSTVTLDLIVSDNAAVGRYTRPLVLHVCRDAACASEYAGFPRTIQKDVTIQGTTVGTSALSFTSTAGVAPASQAVTVTPPAGIDFGYDSLVYVTYTAPDGSTSLMYIDSSFTITKTPTGFDVRPNGNWAGRYVGRLSVTTPGYATVHVDLDYQVSAATTQVLTQLTASVADSGKAGASTDIPVYVAFVHNMDTVGPSSIGIEATGGSPDPGGTFWIRYYDTSFFTYGAGPTDNAERLLFYLNPCFLGTNCLPAGTYTANIVYTANAFGQTSPYTVPVTFTVNP